VRNELREVLFDTLSPDRGSADWPFFDPQVVRELLEYFSAASRTSDRATWFLLCSAFSCGATGAHRWVCERRLVMGPPNPPRVLIVSSCPGPENPQRHKLEVGGLPRKLACGSS